MGDTMRFLFLVMFTAFIVTFFSNFKPEIGVKGTLELMWKGTK